MHITSSEIRTKYLEFFKSKNHAIIPSAPLVPENDPTTLFTGSGMQPMVPYLLGERHPLGTRITDSQKCFRTQDIEEVGDNRHTTFFEMLGNWSFGDYFKEEQITWMWTFLINDMGLDPKNFYITCFKGNNTLNLPRDTFSAELWKNLFKTKGLEVTIGENPEIDGILDNNHIFYYGEKKNWWSRAWVPNNMPVGEPGWPDTEMFYDFHPELGRSCIPNTPFSGEFCHVNCDCGRFMEIGNNVFMQYKKTETGFEELPKMNVDFGGGLERICAAINNNPDVFETDIFGNAKQTIERISGITYWVNEKTTYAYRVILDHLRAATFLISDGVVPSNKDQGYFTRRLIRRAVRFARDLGINISFAGEIASSYIDIYCGQYTDLRTRKDFILSEMNKEEEQFGKTLRDGMKEFEKLVRGFAIAFERTGQKVTSISGQKAFHLYDTYGFPIEMTDELAKEQGLTVDMAGFNEAFQKHQELSRTASEGKFKWGLADSGMETTELHSACHMMLAGLRKVLGDHVHQAGANITAERLRFDFTHGEKMTLDQLKAVEEYVNEAIAANATMVMSEMDKEEARSTGVAGSFWEKYPDKVKVYTLSGPDGTVYTRELCGGPHIETTANMGTFKIQKEEASSAGVRRIKAVLVK